MYIIELQNFETLNTFLYIWHCKKEDKCVVCGSVFPYLILPICSQKGRQCILPVITTPVTQYYHANGSMVTHVSWYVMYSSPIV